MKILALARASPQRRRKSLVELQGTDGTVHLRHRVDDAAGAADRAVLHRRIMPGRTSPGVRRAGPGTRAAIQMSDALVTQRAKLKEKLEILWGNCNAHARRRFVEVTPNSPEECRSCWKAFATCMVTRPRPSGGVSCPRRGCASPGAQPAGDGCPPRLVEAQFNEKESGAQLGAGKAILIA